MIQRVLFLECSPRHDRSVTTKLARRSIAALQRVNAQLVVDHAPLWLETMPRFVGPAVEAKYAVFSGEALDDGEREAWLEIEECVERFKRADLILIAAPMWNFGVPYVLKHYIDVVTQPGLVFAWSPRTGYRSLLAPRRALVVTSSAGDYSGTLGDAAHDFHRPYLTDWLETYMGCRVSTLSVAPTVADEEVVARAEDRATASVPALVESWTSESWTHTGNLEPTDLEDEK